jgi:hypothetical protein
MIRATALPLLLSLAACGSNVTLLPPVDGAASDAPAVDDAAAPDASAADAAPAPDAAPDAADASAFNPWTPDAGSNPAPIETPVDTWSWVPFADSACGNGMPTGIGVNRSTRSNRVLMFLMGGGGCWDALTCHLLNTAANLNTGYTESSFNREIGSVGSVFIFNRADMRNPFRDATFVFVPYCTGDIHGGNNVMQYTVSGQQRTTYHVGARNMESYLARLSRSFPRTDKVWLMGSSAGGYGAGIHWDRVARAFPMARVDLLDDSGPPINPPMARYAAMQAAWNLQFPTGCPRCADDLSALLPYYRERFPPPHRMGLLSYTQDRTISTYFGLTGAQFESSLNDLLRTGFDPAPNFRYFVAAGTNHTMVGGFATLRGPGGASLLDWVTAWATDTTPWANVRP